MQVVPGVEHFQPDIGMARSERLGERGGHDVVLRAVKDEGGLAEVRTVLIMKAVLNEVDLDTVTKKQVRALVEQRLQSELSGERRTFMDRQIDNELANM